MARLIDADAFDRWLAAAEFDAALNNADDENRPFREQAMYYSTQSFRDVMRHQPTIDAIPVEWMESVLNEAKEYPMVDRELIVAIPYLIKRWRREQEG